MKRINEEWADYVFKDEISEEMAPDAKRTKESAAENLASEAAAEYAVPWVRWHES